MSQKKFAKTARNTTPNKRTFVKRLLKDSTNINWPKEMKIVKTLFSIFPNELFWNSLDLGFKLNSLCWLLSDDGRKLLNREYKKFNFLIPQKNLYLPDKDLEQDSISCRTDGPIKPKTLKDFLKLW